MLKLETGTFSVIDLMLLMCSTLLGSGIWLLFATLSSLPVSTTHSIVGSVIGCGWLMGGFDFVNYNELLPIVISWVASPAIGFITTFLIWIVLKRLTISSSNPIRNFKIITPFMTGTTFGVVVLFLIYKGLKPMNVEPPLYIAIPSAVGFGILVTIVAALAPYLYNKWLERRNIKKDDDMFEKQRLQENIQTKFGDKVYSGYNIDPPIDDTDLNVVEKAEFDSFNFLVILTSCALAMAHGSNDIANAAGPLTAIVLFYKYGRITDHYELWVIIITAIGLLIGLATLGYKVMLTIGSSITKMTSSRAFVVQFSTAFITLTFSGVGIPLSTTHIVVGAVFGISLADITSISDIGKLQWGLFVKIILSWFVTIPAAAFIAMGFFSILKILNSHY